MRLCCTEVTFAWPCRATCSADTFAFVAAPLALSMNPMSRSRSLRGRHAPPSSQYCRTQCRAGCSRLGAAVRVLDDSRWPIHPRRGGNHAREGGNTLGVNQPRPRAMVLTPSPVLTVTIEAQPDGSPEIHVHPGGQGVWIARMLSRLGLDLNLAPVERLPRNVGFVATSSQTARCPQRLPIRSPSTPAYNLAAALSSF